MNSIPSSLLSVGSQNSALSQHSPVKSEPAFPNLFEHMVTPDYDPNTFFRPQRTERPIQLVLYVPENEKNHIRVKLFAKTERSQQCRHIFIDDFLTNMKGAKTKLCKLTRTFPSNLSAYLGSNHISRKKPRHMVNDFYVMTLGMRERLLTCGPIVSNDNPLLQCTDDGQLKLKPEYENLISEEGVRSVVIEKYPPIVRVYLLKHCNTLPTKYQSFMVDGHMIIEKTNAESPMDIKFVAALRKSDNEEKIGTIGGFFEDETKDTLNAITSAHCVVAFDSDLPLITRMAY